MTYLDTSALVSLLVPDAHTTAIRGFFRTGRPEAAVSSFGLAEFGATLGNKVRRQELSPSGAGLVFAALEGWTDGILTILDIDPADHHAAAALVRRFDLGLRAPDALHLALCQRLALPILTFDARQAAAARALGIAAG